MSAFVPLPPPPALTRTHLRLAGFVALSLVLHLLTGYGTGPFSLTARPFVGGTHGTQLHASLMPGHSAPQPAAPEPTTDTATPATEGGAARTPDAEPAPASTLDGGAPIPAPDKWHLANEVDVRAEPLTDVALRYPEGLRGNPAAGTVRLRLFIDEGGVVRKLQIAASEPPGVFDETARKAWQEVRFSPARRNGAPVKSQKLIEVNYQPGLP